jgi:hypothetical protein
MPGISVAAGFSLRLHGRDACATLAGSGYCRGGEGAAPIQGSLIFLPPNEFCQRLYYIRNIVGWATATASIH